ncbi:hypothetical protein [Salinibacter ruber]|uniref:hypothetical protein n=1 Tax=Salinibacter ruber TaxID=146919 RepID=UPI0020738B7E|nr:hypothetical protein [Salinibacter ruber]
MTFSVLQFGHARVLVFMSEFCACVINRGKSQQGLWPDDSDEKSGDDSSTHYLLGAFF